MLKEGFSFNACLKMTLVHTDALTCSATHEHPTCIFGKEDDIDVHCYLYWKWVNTPPLNSASVESSDVLYLYFTGGCNYYSNGSKINKSKMCQLAILYHFQHEWCPSHKPGYRGAQRQSHDLLVIESPSLSLSHAESDPNASLIWGEAHHDDLVPWWGQKLRGVPPNRKAKHFTPHKPLTLNWW